MPVFTSPRSPTYISCPSRPAKCTRLEPSVTVDDERDPEFWLDDGNIVVVVQDAVAFRVHKSVLARRSQVFSRLFAVPQPPDEANVETMDGHAVVRVHDSLHDFKHLLRALYDGSYTYVAASQLRSCPKFGALAALIRLGHKYDVPHVQETALRRLKAHFADNFNAWKTYEPEAIEAVNLFRQCGLDDLLPAALFLCTTIDMRIFLAGSPRADSTLETLSASDLQRCLVGRERLVERSAKYNRHMITFFGPQGRTDCPGSPDAQCRAKFALVWAEMGRILNEENLARDNETLIRSVVSRYLSASPGGGEARVLPGFKLSGGSVVDLHTVPEAVMGVTDLPEIMGLPPRYVPSV